MTKMENEEVKEVSPVETTVVREKDSNGKNGKCNSDARTFLIALLTSVIVVLAYHGIVSMFSCSRADECPPRMCVMKWGSFRECEVPRKHFRHQEKRRRCDRENCENPRHRHHREDSQRPIQQEQAE